MIGIVAAFTPLAVGEIVLDELSDNQIGPRKKKANRGNSVSIFGGVSQDRDVDAKDPLSELEQDDGSGDFIMGFDIGYWWKLKKVPFEFGVEFEASFMAMEIAAFNEQATITTVDDRAISGTTVATEVASNPSSSSSSSSTSTTTTTREITDVNTTTRVTRIPASAFSGLAPGAVPAIGTARSEANSVSGTLTGELSSSATVRRDGDTVIVEQTGVTANERKTSTERRRTPARQDVKTDANAAVFLLNAYIALDLHRYRARLGPILSRVKPYAGAGVGGAQFWFRNTEVLATPEDFGTPLSPFATDEFVFATKYFAGVEYAITRKFSAYAEYQRFGFHDFDDLDDIYADFWVGGVKWYYDAQDELSDEEIE